MSDPLDESLVGLATEREAHSLGRESPYAPHRVQRLIHEALLAGGLGTVDADAPFKDIVQPGMHVLLKPNWVLHANKSGHSRECLVTHPEFIFAALEQVCRAEPQRVVIGDAPIQTCDFDALVTSEFRARAAAIAWAAGVRLEIVDFRRTVADAGVNLGRENQRSLDRFVLFDLADASLLEGFASPQENFRVTNYDPRRLASTHTSGKHQYLLCKEAFEADVVLSLPKLKTHCKAGVTGALKNLVGFNGSKEFLPHHRCGSPTTGGDCYAQPSTRKRWAEFCLDHANKNIGRAAYPIWRALAYARIGSWGRIEPYGLEGAWHGNNTVWRTVLDINRALRYGRLDGTLSEQPQRQIFSLTDAIVCGQGDGPLAPTPLDLHAVTFANNPVIADLVHSELLQFDWRAIPVLRESFTPFKYPLTRSTPDAALVMIGAQTLTAEQAGAAYGASAEPARGWMGQVEKRNEILHRHSA